MNIFVACPVRNLRDNMREHIELEVTRLESEGNKVHLPYRDTDQNDARGYRICHDNRRAIEEADYVLVFWDGESQGVLFDLGMAFAMLKPVRAAIGCFPPMTRGKSFQNMVYTWEEYSELRGEE